MTYLWIDTNTGKKVEVQRKMADSDTPPDKPEALDAGFSALEFAAADWAKIITGGAGHIGFGQKGNW